MQKTAAGVDVRASGPKTESDRTVSQGASDVHWAVWIQALTLLGPREVVRTAANMPGPCSTGELQGCTAQPPARGAAFTFALRSIISRLQKTERA
jgi:hypothetical protein